MVGRKRLAYIDIELQAIGYIPLKIVRINFLGIMLFVVDKPVQHIVDARNAFFVVLAVMVNYLTLRVKGIKVFVDPFLQFGTVVPQIAEHGVQVILKKIVNDQLIIGKKGIRN